MSDSSFRWWPLVVSVLLAVGLWFVTFYLAWGNFWVKISFSSSILAGFSLCFQKDLRQRVRFDGKALIIGVLSAGALYLLFAVGKAVSTHAFSFAGEQIGGIYQKGTGTRMGVIAALLFLVTGPCEELYWRGYLQDQLERRLGGTEGWLLSAAVYAGVHLWALNFMLVGAAAVAGAFWGYMYWRLGNLAPVIISHSLWSAAIFAVFPLT